jgi:NAD(P)H-hydrate epimerase
MVAARHLHNWGADVHLLLAADRDRLKDVPAHQLHILDAMGVPRVSADVLEADDLVVDALLGYGLVGNPRRRMAELIERVNQSSCPVLALDAPSGLDTTTGRPGTPCVQATATLTLALPKTGLLTMAGRAKAGDLYLGDISVPPGLYRQMGIDVPVLFPDGPLRKL